MQTKGLTMASAIDLSALSFALEVRDLKVTGKGIHLGASGLASVTGDRETLEARGFTVNWTYSQPGKDDPQGVALYPVGDAVDLGDKVLRYDRSTGLTIQAGNQYVPLPADLTTVGSVSHDLVEVQTVTKLALEAAENYRGLEAHNGDREVSLSREDMAAAEARGMSNLEYRKYLNLKADRRAKAEERRDRLGAADGYDDPTTVPVIMGEAFSDIERPDHHDVVEGFTPWGGLTLLYAQEKLGKTMVAHDLASCLSTGEKFMDTLEVQAVPEGQRVVIFDSELETWDAAERLEALGITPDRVALIPVKAYSRSLDFLDLEKASAWATRLRDMGAYYVIFDTLGPILTRNGYDNNTEAGDYILALREVLDIAGVTGTTVVDHESPKALEKGKGPKGDSSKTAYASQIVHLQGERGDDGSLPTEYTMDARGRAGDHRWNVTRKGTWFSADPDNAPTFTVDREGRDAYAAFGTVTEILQRVHNQISGRAADPDDPANWPTKSALLEMCCDESALMGRDRFRRAVSRLITDGCLAYYSPSKGSRVVYPTGKQPVNPPASLDAMGTPLDPDAPAPHEKVFGPQPVPNQAEDDGAPEDLEAAVEDTPRPSLEVVPDLPDDTPDDGAADTPED